MKKAHHAEMKTAFIVGNGTSRSPIDLSCLKGEGSIIGCNALYRDFPEYDYLVAIDDGMIEELSRECSLDLPDGTPTANLGKRIHLTPGVCKRIGKCFDTWREDWSKEEGVVVMSEEMGEEMGGVANTVGDEDDGESEGEEVEDDDDEWDED